MNIRRITLGLVAASVAFSLVSSVGCDKKDGDAAKEPAAAASAPAAAAAEGSKEAAQPAAAAAEAEAPKATAAKQMQGKWGIDTAAVQETEEFKNMPEEEKKMALQMMETMAGSLTIEITSDKMIMAGMGQNEESTYKVTSEDGNKVVIDAVSKKNDIEKTETLNIEIKGPDAISIKSGEGEAMPLKRK